MPGSPSQARNADLVLEAGGVKGIALAGAIRAFVDHGYSFQRIAGTSAGALAGAVLAAMTNAGESPDRIVDITRSLDRSKLTDRSRWGRVAARIGLGGAADIWSVLLHNGMYRGDYLERWLTGVLGEFGVRTFGDLRLPADPDSDIPEDHRFRLVAVVSDVSRHRMVRLPWDYQDYGLDPDEQPVAPAVRASTAIPFFFQPEILRGGPRLGKATLVDGGVISGYPITIFDRTDGKLPRWPTFGVRLSAPEPAAPHTKPIRGPLSLALNLVGTMTDARDALQLAEKRQRMRTTFVDTEGISGVDFQISDELEDDLIDRGERAAKDFLENWSFDRYRVECRGKVQ